MRKKTKRYTPDGHPIEVYRKGRKHKVYIDTVTHEVVMTNPLPLAALAIPAARVAAPYLIQKGTEMIQRKREKRVSPETPLPQKEKLTVFEKAYLAEMMDRRRC